MGHLRWTSAATLLAALNSPACAQPCLGAWSATREHATSPFDSVFTPISEPARLGAGVALFDDRAISWTTGGPARRFIPAAGLLIDRDGRIARIEYPGGDARYRYPIAASDASGRAHVVWGTAAEDTAYIASPRVDTLWYAIYDGRSWTKPTAIWAGTGLQWNPISRSALVVTGDTVYFAASSPSPASRSAVLYLRGSGTEWRASRIDARGAGFYPVVLTPARGSLAIGHIGALLGSPEGFDSNSIFIVRSSDGGGTWSAPELVRRSLRNRARLLEAAGGGAEPAYLVWVHSSPEQPGQDTLGVARVGADSTVHLGAVSLGTVVRAMSVALDAQGDLHVLAREQRGRGQALVHRRFGTNPWIERPSVVLDSSALSHALLRLSPDSLYAAWVHVPAAPLTPTVRAATFVRDCRTR